VTGRQVRYRFQELWSEFSTPRGLRLHPITEFSVKIPLRRNHARLRRFTLDDREKTNAAAAKPYSACDGEIHAARDESHCRDTQRQPARRQTDRRQDGGEGLDRTPTRRAREAGLLHYDLRTGSPEVANTVAME
jgi:hypothetical protein